jgi:CHAT domain-containing protein/tetratricopeptide (TPR) repeat protein
MHAFSFGDVDVQLRSIPEEHFGGSPELRDCFTHLLHQCETLLSGKPYRFLSADGVVPTEKDLWNLNLFNAFVEDELSGRYLQSPLNNDPRRKQHDAFWSLGLIWAIQLSRAVQMCLTRHEKWCHMLMRITRRNFELYSSSKVSADDPLPHSTSVGQYDVDFMEMNFLALDALSEISLLLGDPWKSEVFAKFAISQYVDLPHPLQWMTDDRKHQLQCRLGQAYTEQEDFPKAHQQLLSVIGDFKRYPSEVECKFYALVYDAAFQAAKGLSNLEAMDEYLQRGKLYSNHWWKDDARVTSPHFSRGLYLCTLREARVLLLQSNFDDATLLLEKCYFDEVSVNGAQLSPVENIDYRAYTAFLLGFVCHMQLDYANAVNWYEKATRVMDAGGRAIPQLLTLNIFNNLADALFEQGEHQRALEWVKRLFRDVGFVVERDVPNNHFITKSRIFPYAFDTYIKASILTLDAAVVEQSKHLENCLERFQANSRYLKDPLLQFLAWRMWGWLFLVQGNLGAAIVQFESGLRFLKSDVLRDGIPANLQSQGWYAELHFLLAMTWHLAANLTPTPTERNRCLSQAREEAQKSWDYIHQALQMLRSHILPGGSQQYSHFIQKGYRAVEMYVVCSADLARSPQGSKEDMQRAVEMIELGRSEALKAEVEMSLTLRNDTSSRIDAVDVSEVARKKGSFRGCDDACRLVYSLCEPEPLVISQLPWKLRLDSFAIFGDGEIAHSCALEIDPNNQETQITSTDRLFTQFVKAHLRDPKTPTVLSANPERFLLSTAAQVHLAAEAFAVQSIEAERTPNAMAFQIFLQPFWKNASVYRRLIISPDGRLSLLPWNCFFDEQSRQFVVESHPTSVEPSDAARHYETICANMARKSPALSILLAGVPEGVAKELWQKELRAIKEALEKHNLGYPNPIACDMLTDVELGIQGIAGQLPLHHLLLHLTTHTVEEVHQAGQSDSLQQLALQLGGKANQLSHKDITSQLIRGSRLVTLSACSSLLGRQHNYEALNLCRDFLIAGVPAICCTVCPVMVGPTTELMELFYQEVFGDRESKRPPRAFDQALQLAMCKYLKAHPDMPMRNWASFTIFGLGDLSLAQKSDTDIL